MCILPQTYPRITRVHTCTGIHRLAHYRHAQANRTQHTNFQHIYTHYISIPLCITTTTHPHFMYRCTHALHKSHTHWVTCHTHAQQRHWCACLKSHTLTFSYPEQALHTYTQEKFNRQPVKRPTEHWGYGSDNKWDLHQVWRGNLKKMLSWNPDERDDGHNVAVADTWLQHHELRRQKLLYPLLLN